MARLAAARRRRRARRTCRSCTAPRASAGSPSSRSPGSPATRARAPVRIGNAASEQFQLDVYGEVLDALYQTPPGRRRRPTPTAWDLEHRAARVPRGAWRQPDDGHLGGARAAPALHALEGDGVGRVRPRRHGDRGVPPRRRRRRSRLDSAIRDEIHDRGLRRGLRHRAAGTFTQSYGSKRLDAARAHDAARRLPPRDRRARARHGRGDPARADARRLRRPLRATDGRRRRPAAGRGRRSSPARSGWPTTSRSWAATTRRDALFERLLGLANDVGLLAEEYDPVGDSASSATSPRRSPTSPW